MKKNDLKKLLRPIVKECIEESIHEALFESGIVTNVVAEVIRGINIPQLVESVQPRRVPQPVNLPSVKSSRMTEVVNAVNSPNEMEVELNRQRSEHKAEMIQARTRLKESLGKTLGVNVFEGVTPVPGESQAAGHSSLSGIDPSDPGVNLASIPGLSTLNFKNHIKE